MTRSWNGVSLSRAVRAVALAVALSTESGCSWLHVNSPPRGPIDATPQVECTSSNESPTADTVWAVVLATAGVGLIVAGAASQSHSEPCGPNQWFCGLGESLVSPWRTAAFIAGGVSVAGAFSLGFSSAYGYSTTGECRDLKETQLSCISGVEAACRALKEHP